MRRFTPFILGSICLHAGMFALVAFSPEKWLLALAILFANHAAIGVAGLLPRSRLLGPNLVHLPDEAANRAEVALTFDDGPDPEVTPKVLEILGRHGVRATFFCIGERAAAHPEICREIVSSGHEIENHGQRHRNHLAFSGVAGWMREVGEGQKTIEAITGRRPEFYRALAGLRNPFLDPVLQKLGIRLASWTRRGYDTRCSDSEAVLSRLTKGLKAGDILLLHDGHGARSETGDPVVLEVLPLLLSELEKRNLKPVSLGNPLRQRHADRARIMMFPDHDWIASRIPHKANMCLLDRVIGWNETQIFCRAKSHRFPDNPLRQEGMLGITTGIEYAAQAMAVHGALLAGNEESPAAGYLTSVRNVRWKRSRLDDLDGEIEVRAERLSGNELNILYSFGVSFGEEMLIEGRASVMLDASSAKLEKNS